MNQVQMYYVYGHATRIKPIREYMGRTIWHNPMPGKLPWTSGNLAADTLAGIKALIRDDEKRA